MPEKRYVVGNPRGLPPDSTILRYGNRRWLAGETFVKPKDMSSADVQSLLKRGFLEVMKDG